MDLYCLYPRSCIADSLPPLICGKPHSRERKYDFWNIPQNVLHIYTHHGLEQIRYELPKHAPVDGKYHPRFAHELLSKILMFRSSREIIDKTLVNFAEHAITGYDPMYMASRYTHHPLYIASREQDVSIAMIRIMHILSVRDAQNAIPTVTTNDISLQALENLFSSSRERICPSLEHLFDPITSPIIHFLNANCAQYVTCNILRTSMQLVADQFGRFTAMRLRDIATYGLY